MKFTEATPPEHKAVIKRGPNWPFPYKGNPASEDPIGFIPDKWMKGVCTDKQHNAPLMMHVPVGKTIEWHCPVCGNVSFHINNDALM